MARSAFLDVVQLHRRQLAAVVEVAGAGGARKVYEDARRDLRDKLAALVRAGRGETFGAHHLRVVMLQVADTIRRLEAGLEGSLKKTGRAAAELAPRHLVDLVEEGERIFGRVTPVIPHAQVALFRSLYRGDDPSLLDRYRSSVRLYGAPAISKIRDALAASLVRKESVDDAVDRVAGTSGTFEGQRWRAERIVRTELSYSYGHQDAAVDGGTAPDRPAPDEAPRRDVRLARRGTTARSSTARSYPSTSRSSGSSRTRRASRRGRSSATCSPRTAPTTEKSPSRGWSAGRSRAWVRWARRAGTRRGEPLRAGDPA